MPMNEFDENDRTNNQINGIDNNYTTDWSFSSEVENRFWVAKKRNFNFITLIIAVPLYSAIGYFTTQYLLSQGFAIKITCLTGAIIGAIVAIISTLLYNKKWAKTYEGFEYLISLLFTGLAVIALGFAIVLLCIVVGVMKVVLQVIIGAVLVIAILVGLTGG